MELKRPALSVFQSALNLSGPTKTTATNQNGSEEDKNYHSTATAQDFFYYFICFVFEFRERVFEKKVNFQTSGDVFYGGERHTSKKKAIELAKLVSADKSFNECWRKAEISLKMQIKLFYHFNNY
ncbi:hypothetical protein BpHYR1_047725 [Brachionus plicatilis]|uniref:Uncharacterized protein n=1 Tax=Brachionus plicatilis TaxID=10195 RepID=A0A3M7P178_BRAPC|nr:hypothetical protein BpHYR1_047725 [Brachionus plicatilis]